MKYLHRKHDQIGSLGIFGAFPRCSFKHELSSMSKIALFIRGDIPNWMRALKAKGPSTYWRE